MKKLKFEEIQSIPYTPGCYLFKDKDGNILYVGKSKCLRKRVASYFRPQKDTKIEKMMMFAAGVSHMPTDTDIDALLMEHRLIKEHRPPYNARMRKDRQSWYIQIDVTQMYPSLCIVPETQDSPVLSIGSFLSEDSAVQALETIGICWQLPTCGQDFSRVKRPCLRFQIKQCIAPCSGEVGYEVYQSAVQGACTFLCGGDASVHESMLGKLERQMREATEAQEYEKAADLRDIHEDLHRLSRQLANMPPALEGKDYCVFIKSRHEECFILAYLQDGCVRAYMRFDSISDFLHGDKLGILARYIGSGRLVPADRCFAPCEFATLSKDEGFALAGAIIEIDAIRKFADIAQELGNPERIVQVSKALIAGDK